MSQEQSQVGRPQIKDVSIYLLINKTFGGPYDLPTLANMYANGKLPQDTIFSFDCRDWKNLYDLRPLIDAIIRKASEQSQAQQSDVTQAPTDVPMQPPPLPLNLDDGLGGGIQQPPSASPRETIPENDFNVPRNDDYLYDASSVVTCPHCWHEFPMENALYIACHPELLGDEVLGEAAQTRFSPTVLNEQNYAYDDRGMLCRDMACPRCHLKIPEIVISEKMDVISIVGAPASGKSYFITALTNMVRKNLPEFFGHSFCDADVSMNRVLNGYEDTLFNNISDDKVALPKTELQGSDFSSQVRLNGININLPLPYIFTISKIHDNSGNATKHNIVMYDNAGEHFQAGQDSVTNLATMHLIKSSLIMFLFDPFKDSDSIRDCKDSDPQKTHIPGGRVNQGQILQEMINRIKKYRGMQSSEKSNQMLVVLVPKYDAWEGTFPFDLKKTAFTYFNQGTYQYSLNLTLINLVSYCTRQWLLKRAPDIVTSSESFFETVYFMPVSALGTSPDYDEKGDKIVIKPSKIKPIWVDVPMYLYLWRNCGILPAVNLPVGNLDYTDYIKYLWNNGLVPSAESTKTNVMTDVHGKFMDDSFMFMDEQSKRPLTIPSLYWGEIVYDMNLERFLRFPKKPQDFIEEKKPGQGTDNYRN